VKTILSFLKATIAGGFFVLLPVVLLWLILTEIVDLAIAMLQPVAGLLPVETIGGIGLTRIVAVLMILLVCLVTGLLMKTRLARTIGGWFEKTLLGQIPGYTLIKGLTQRFAGAATGSQFAPALVNVDSGFQEVAFIVEEHSSGAVTVFVPFAPMPNIGTVRVVSRDRLQRVDASMGTVVNSLMQWGVGSQALLHGEAPPSAKERAD
jgi:uncharacterized membrane protein